MIDKLPKPEGDRYRFGRATFLTQRARREYLEWRFWSRVVERLDGCWEWFGPATKDGYGVFQVQERYMPGNRPSRGAGVFTVSVARYAWERERGEVPVRGRLERTCARVGCVSPEHARVVLH